MSQECEIMSVKTSLTIHVKSLFRYQFREILITDRARNLVMDKIHPLFLEHQVVQMRCSTKQNIFQAIHI